jgi:hypothetical protein
VAHVVVEAPNVLCARALVERAPTAVRCAVEPADGESCGVRMRCSEDLLPGLLSVVESWLSDYAIESVRLTLDGRWYTLTAPPASLVRPRDPNELPDDVVVEA